MRIAYLFLAVFVLTAAARADGLPLRDGRYPGEVLVFDLTAAQKKVINLYRTCQLENFGTMNIYSPYVFRLTPSQSQALKEKKGFSPKYFQIYETVRGFNDAGRHWNLALRFSRDQIEIPLDLVVTNKEARVEHNEQGWKRHSPCFPKLGKQ
ncbi:hypothetical protein NP603_19770 [Methylomonas sp. SURF-1]|uniref:Uncharacterized protein n=1 Tax=Methylomonas aurea TaxID=2952224 RepID=A0ABT1UMA6_9GAMM|nr:hypothetical protein [Methylomonas sp. SURF-1]MCQ8183360.1 hypothetical protein [Methylomonas sp. SURF-1]